ncbi:hypothetical protein AXX17_AT1G75180 [Arabidopsis thaliana]|uniref:Uncharacterized protein n=1 Tax=Arabidopsis thaliana TaxID=3702 RepID=A0A178W6L8_ARATH|nr:hypothetical protein AXX17_AT1G75180 [Arabidopsis thaliana]
MPERTTNLVGDGLNPTHWPVMVFNWRPPTWFWWRILMKLLSVCDTKPVFASPFCCLL